MKKKWKKRNHLIECVVENDSFKNRGIALMLRQIEKQKELQKKQGDYNDINRNG